MPIPEARGEEGVRGGDEEGDGEAGERKGVRGE